MRLALGKELVLDAIPGKHGKSAQTIEEEGVELFTLAKERRKRAERVSLGGFVGCA